MISGGGTNLQALIDAQKAGELDCEIVLVVSNREAAYGLVRAENAGIPTVYFPLKPYLQDGKSRDHYDRDLADRVMEAKPDLIVLAGWMHVLSPAFLDNVPDHVINLHPALPDQFPGLNAIQRAFQAYQVGAISESGCMVHYVIPQVDAGPVIGKVIVPFEKGDTLDSFEARIHAAEHELIVAATRRALEDLDV